MADPQYFNVPKVLVREPRLLLPRQGPVGEVKVDWANPQSIDLVSAWPLTNGNYRDHGKFGINLTNRSGMARKCLPPFGNALYTSSIAGACGGGDYFPLVGSELSICFWWYVETRGIVTICKSADGVIDSSYWDWGILGYSGGYYVIRNGANNTVTPNLYFPLGKWSFICARNSESAHDFSVDCVSVRSGSGIGTGTTKNTSGRKVWVGGNSNGTYQYSQIGSLADVRIYNRYLRDDEVRELYRNPFGCYVHA